MPGQPLAFTPRLRYKHGALPHDKGIRAKASQRRSADHFRRGPGGSVHIPGRYVRPRKPCDHGRATSASNLHVFFVVAAGDEERLETHCEEVQLRAAVLKVYSVVVCGFIDSKADVGCPASGRH